MLLFRQSLESQKSQVIPDDKLRGPFDNDDDQQKVTENLSFDSDYDIFIQKIGKNMHHLLPPELIPPLPFHT